MLLEITFCYKKLVTITLINKNTNLRSTQKDEYLHEYASTTHFNFTVTPVAVPTIIVDDNRLLSVIL